ncbi:hypothetical protein RAA17_09420 [Komagataeibacter rhaeticus]|nr:hypothetical protein [Komagataeibacter rhaeticus]
MLKTYAWDSFVHRQLRRLQSTFPDTDIFVSVDETNGFVGTVAHDRVLRTCNADMVAMGFANRFEKGSLIWWNADYTHYQVHDRIPDYDYYLFVEYDACITGDGQCLLAAMMADGADFVAHPISSGPRWYWARFHAGVYPAGRLRASLNCISFFQPGRCLIWRAGGLPCRQIMAQGSHSGRWGSLCGIGGGCGGPELRAAGALW